MQERHQALPGPLKKKIRVTLPETTFGQVVRDVKEMKERLDAITEKLRHMDVATEKLRRMDVVTEKLRRMDAERLPLFIANLFTSFITKMMKEKGGKAPKSRGPHERNKKGKGKAPLTEDRETSEGPSRGHDNSRIVQYAASITRTDLEELGLGKYEPALKCLSQIIKARNRAAHETPTAFARYLLKPEHEADLHKWRAIFTWTYNATVEDMASQETDDFARLYNTWEL